MSMVEKSREKSVKQKDNQQNQMKEPRKISMDLVTWGYCSRSQSYVSDIIEEDRGVGLG